MMKTLIAAIAVFLGASTSVAYATGIDPAAGENNLSNALVSSLTKSMGYQDRLFKGVILIQLPEAGGELESDKTLVEVMQAKPERVKILEIHKFKEGSGQWEAREVAKGFTVELQNRITASVARKLAYVAVSPGNWKKLSDSLTLQKTRGANYERRRQTS